MNLDDASIAAARAKARIENIVNSCLSLMNGPAKMTLDEAVKEVKSTHGAETAEEVRKKVLAELTGSEVEL